MTRTPPRTPTRSPPTYGAAPTPSGYRYVPFPLLPNPPAYVENPLPYLPGFQPVYRIGSILREVTSSLTDKQPMDDRTPFELDPAHGYRFANAIDSFDIPLHADGIAYVNFRDRKFQLVTKDDARHVWVPRPGSPPLSVRKDLVIWCLEVARALGSWLPDSGRWFYFYADPEFHAPNHVRLR
jgi:hypothetical protein